MRSKIFILDKPSKFSDPLVSQEAEYCLPILPAYAIEYAELKVPPNLDGVGKTELLEGREFTISGDKVIWPGYRAPLLGRPAAVTLIIHCHGIRSYERLFPSVRGDDRARRLGQFYEEADKTFEEGAWLSFLLMCGAVFEGLLFDRLDEDLSFSRLARKALDEGTVSEKEYNAMDRVRNLRNAVHLSRISKVYATREEAMDTRKILDDMIVRFSYGVTNGK